MTVVRAAGFDSATLASFCASENWIRGAVVLKRDDHSSVLTGDSQTGPVVVKSMLLDRPADFFKCALGTTRLMRQWRGADLLAKHGFTVARPLVLWRGRDARGRLVESLAMERLHGKTVLEHLAERDLPSEYEIVLARRIGEDIARLACIGLVNRDHKTSNLLVVRPVIRGMNDPTVAILDTVGIRRSRKRGAIARMLFQLMVEPIGCGVDVPFVLRLGTVRAAVRATGLRNIDNAWLWLDVRERLVIHGDPTPRVNPLADHTKQ